MSKKPNVTFSYALSNFLSSYLPDTKGVRENTILSYRDTFSLFLIYCREQYGIAPEKLSFKKIDRQLVEDFLKWLENERHCSISTRNQRLTAIRSLFRYIEIYYPEHLLLCEQIISIPSKTAQQKPMNYLSKEETELLLSLPNTRKRQGQRDAMLLSLLYDTGARVQEIVDVRSQDVRLEFPATIRLSGKGGKVRIIPLSTGTANLMQLYMGNLYSINGNTNTPLFCNRSGQKMTRAGITYILEKYAKMARQISGTFPDTLSPHCLRHSKAMHLLQEGVNLVYIRDLLGHTDIRTTEIYAHADSSAKRKALEKASPIKSSQQFPSWTEDDSLLSWLQSFGRPSSKQNIM